MPPLMYSYIFDGNYIEYKTQPTTLGRLVYASYYANNASKEIAVFGSAALMAYLGVATLDSLEGAP